MEKTHCQSYKTESDAELLWETQKFIKQILNKHLTKTARKLNLSIHKNIVPILELEYTRMLITPLKKYAETNKVYREMSVKMLLILDKQPKYYRDITKRKNKYIFQWNKNDFWASTNWLIDFN